MKYETISKIFNWLSTKWPIALFITIVLLLIALTSCKATQKMTTQTNSQHLLTQTRSDAKMVEDHSIIYDTIHKVVLETLWRAPDTLGKIYPQVTTRTEMTSGHQTQSNVVTQTHDTIYIHDASITSDNTSSDIRAPTTTTTLLPWIIILGMIIISIIIIALRLLK